MSKQYIEEMLQQIQTTMGIDLSGKKPEEFFADEIDSVSELLDIQESEIITFERFIKLPFTSAKRYTENISIEQRFAFLEQMDKHCLYLYDILANYSAGEGVSKENQLSSKDFRKILGQLKHCEILQNWLYGVY